MKKLIVALVTSLFLFIGCASTGTKVKAPEPETLYKAEFTNVTFGKLISLSVVPVPLTEENKQHHHELIVLCPKHYAEEHKNCEFKQDIYIPEGEYVIIFMAESIFTGEFLGWKHLGIYVEQEGQVIFMDGKHQVKNPGQTHNI